LQRPFEGRSQETLSENIKKAQPKYYVTNPAVSVACLRALGSLIQKDRSQRIGAIGFETYTSHMFFAEIDFDALERKEIPPVFRPSSEKTNFDATYDLEELLLEEAPLEARARRQKPRAELREDASAKEIREDELHRLIETMFEPFDYTLTDYQGNAADAIAAVTCVLVPSNAMLTMLTKRLSNPEDCFPVATTAPANAAEHARQFSQPEPRGNPYPTQPDGQYCAPPSQQITPVNENVNPHDPATGPQQQPPSNRVAPSSPPAPSFHRPLPPNHRPRGATRQMSKSGGVQMVLNEAGSWSELAHTSTLPAEGLEGGDDKGKQANGMMSFFSRKKGRDRSPKPTEPGVLGKEGARQIIN
jgi:serine/threonine kinase 32